MESYYFSKSSNSSKGQDYASAQKNCFPKIPPPPQLDEVDNQLIQACSNNASSSAPHIYNKSPHGSVSHRQESASKSLEPPVLPEPSIHVDHNQESSQSSLRYMPNKLRKEFLPTEFSFCDLPHSEHHERNGESDSRSSIYQYRDSSRYSSDDNDNSFGNSRLNHGGRGGRGRGRGRSRSKRSGWRYERPPSPRDKNND